MYLEKIIAMKLMGNFNASRSRSQGSPMLTIAVIVIVCLCVSISASIAVFAVSKSHMPNWTALDLIGGREGISTLSRALSIIKNDPNSSSMKVVVLRQGKTMNVQLETGAMYLVVDANNLVMGAYNSDSWQLPVPASSIVATYNNIGRDYTGA